MVDFGVRSIPLSQGAVALVDDCDYELLSTRTWFLTKGKSRWNYAGTNVPSKDRPHGSTLLMHRHLVNAAPGQFVDHINGDTLDNRRMNLRLCTNAENIRNMRIRGGSSRFKGVYLDKSSNDWRAQIMHNYKKQNLGNFKSEEDAARAYDAAALRLFGEFARLNFPAGGSP